MKRLYKIVLCVVALLLVLTLIFFEIAKVPKITWSKKFEVNDKESGDLYLLSSLLKKKYGKDNFKTIKSDYFDYLEDEGDAILVMVGQRLSFDTIATEQLEVFMEKGGEILFISEHLSYRSDTLVGEFTRRRTRLDTIYEVSWADSCQYTMDIHWRHLDRKKTRVYRYFDKTDFMVESRSEVLASVRDSLPIFKSIEYGKGLLAEHTIPELFINVNGMQEGYLENFNKTFSIFNNRRVVVHRFSRSNINAGNNENSKLKYILSQRSLKYAYYLLLLFALIYLIFSSKRKQRFVRIVQPVKNTSLDYIHTTSNLFMAQNQNHKLVTHMGKIYHNRIAKQYFLNRTDPDFTSLLAKKSRVPITLIESIEKGIRNSNNYDFTDDQLFRLYNDINSFYKNSN